MDTGGLRSLFRRIEFWAIGLLSLLAIGLFLDWRWLRGNEQFRWQRYHIQGMEARVWVTAAVLLIVGLVTFRLMTRQSDTGRAQRRNIVLILFLLGLLVRVAFQFLEHPDPIVTLFYRTVSTRNLGAFYFDAVNIFDMPAFLRAYPEEMANMTGFSPRTHPPGNLILFWGAAQVLERLPWVANIVGAHFRDYLCVARDSPILYYPNHLLAAASLQVAMPFWGALSVVPFFAMARRVFDSPAAIRGSVFLILTPAMVLFMGHWAHVYTLLAILALFLAHLGLEKSRLVFLLIAGVVLSLPTFMSFSNLAVCAMVYGYFLLYHTQRWARSEQGAVDRRVLNRFLIELLTLLIGTASLWIIYRVFSGVSFLEVYRQAMSIHEQITGYRTYGLWLFYNLLDFWLFMGIPAVIAIIGMFGRELSRTKPTMLRYRAYLPFWTFILVLVGLNLTGISRGEVARLWMFFMPLAWLAVLPVLARWSRRQLVVMLAVQITQLLLLGYFVRTIGPSNYPFYVPRPITHALPPEAIPAEAAFGTDPMIRLLGYFIDQPETAGNRQDESAGDVTLFWQADGRVPYPYTVFVHLIDQTGRLAAQHDGMPQQDALPTICWRPGEVVADRHRLVLPAGMNFDSGDLYTGLYRLDLLSQGDANPRLPATWDHGEGDAFPLQPTQD